MWNRVILSPPSVTLIRPKEEGGEDTAFLVGGMGGELYFKMGGKYSEAKRYIQKAILADTNNPELYYLRAKVFYKEKDAHQAISDLQKAVSLDRGGYLDAKRMLAWVYATNPHLNIQRRGGKSGEAR